MELPKVGQDAVQLIKQAEENPSVTALQKLDLSEYNVELTAEQAELPRCRWRHKGVADVKLAADDGGRISSETTASTTSKTTCRKYS